MLLAKVSFLNFSEKKEKMFLRGKHNIIVAVIVILLLCTTLVTYAVGEEYTRQKYRPLIGGIQIHMIKWLGGIIRLSLDAHPH